MPHSHDTHGHGHTHGVVDPSIVTSERGIWAIKWSFAGLMITALLQVAVVILSGSVALLADTIHNFGDASTAIPLWIAFRFARVKPNRRFPYGYARDQPGISDCCATVGSVQPQVLISPPAVLAPTILVTWLFAMSLAVSRTLDRRLRFPGPRVLCLLC